MSPEFLVLIAVATIIGSAIGIFTGAVPGIHVNTAATMLVALYPVFAESVTGIVDEDMLPILVCCCIFSASTVHSFVDFVPSVFIGAPDPDEVLSVLPGHRLLLKGRGMTAVRAAAVGSAVGACSAVALAIPLQWLMLAGLSDMLNGITTAVVVACLVLITVTSGPLEWSVIVAALSGMMGLAINYLDIPSAGVFGDGTLLFPMLTGMFGLPPLLEKTGKGKVPPQTDPGGDPVGPIPGIKGVVTGAVAGWFPGITSTVGASMASLLSRERRPEAFISMVASVGTVTSVFSVVALAVSGSGRSGTAAAAKDLIGDGLSGFCSEAFVSVLISIAFASAVGYAATIVVGRIISGIFDRVPAETVSNAVLILITVLVFLFTGPCGLAVLCVSAAIGMIPPAVGTSRVTMTACLMLPTILGGFGLTAYRFPPSSIREIISAETGIYNARLLSVKSWTL